MGRGRTPNKVQPGDRYRVKTTSITRDIGLRCWSPAPHDYKTWPGEIGTIVRRTWVAATDGSEQSGLWLEFSRGRAIALGSNGTFDEDVAACLMRVK